MYRLPFEDIIGMAHDYTQRIGACENCGFLFTMNPFSEEQLENRYKNESKFEFDADTHVQKENEEYITRCNRVKHFIYDCIGKVESILEIGAASGYNLSLYEETAARMGVEPSKINCELALKKYGIDMFHGSFREFVEVKKKEKYDLIFLSMVLEHIVDPYSFISELKNYNNRYMFIEVPTMDIKNLDEPFGMFCEEHVNLFTFEALNNLMNMAGYGLVDAKIEYGFDKGYPAGWPCMDTIWEHGKNPVDFKPMISSTVLFNEYIKRNEEILEQVSKKVDEIPDDLPIAVWGTGHHVSMLLKNTSLGKKNIVKFYDSDSRKYKYTMHGRPITKFEPADVEKGLVDGIVIGTYIFQKTLCGLIEKTGVKCEIFTFY